MILKSFLLGNLVSLCMKIINSVVVVGLYYGFLTTFSIGPSYLFLLRAHVMEEGEEGTEKKVSATTGFITGQLIMFISIYYAPLHLALGRPHTITVLALPYLLFHFFCNNHKHFFDYGSTTRNSMRNLSIQCVFLNNLIFQLFNHFILPSSMLARLVNIFMFRCNSKMLFVTSSFVGWIIGHILFMTSSFVGWIIGHILFMKWIGLLLVWIKQNRYIRKYIRSNKYLVSELTNSMSMTSMFSIFLLVICVYYLGRIPSPIFSKKLNKLDKMEEEEEEEFDNNRPFGYMYGNKENFKLKILEKNKKDEEKRVFLFEKPLLTFFFDYNRWNRPLRYIRKTNKKFKGSVRKEASQYFFYTCQSDGKQRISFTYPPSLSTFGEMIARRLSLSTLEKLSADELYTDWLYTNKEKKNNLNNEFINRIEALETVFLYLNILETKTRLSNADTKNKKNFLVKLCNAETKNKKNCLVKMYDPFLNGMSRGRMKKIFYSSILNETSIKNCTETSEINKIHDILLPFPNSPEYEQKIERSEKKQVKIDSNNRLKFSLNAILTNSKKNIGINEISKKPPRWSYKLINELEQHFKKRRKEQGIMQGLDHQLRTRRFKRIAFLTRSRRSFKKSQFKNYNLYRKFNRDSGFISYLEEPDFRRAVIKGSMRIQRRKMVIWGPSQGNPHSPLFLEKMEDFPFPISDLTKLFFNIRNWLGKKSEFEILDQQFQIKKNNQEDAIEFWENIPYAQKSRSVLLLAQSIFRRYLKLPLLIIVKNIGRILLRQSPEWYEDFLDWNREIYLKCSYNGLQFSKTEFPKNWLREGFQIKILYPFHLKPWNKAKLRLYDRDRKQQDDFDSCFLTVLGMETEYPFGPPRKTPSFFEPILKDIDYKVEIRKLNFRVRRVLKKITKKEAKTFLFVKKKIKELLKGKKIPLFIPREIYESIETQTEKDSIISNKIIHESFSQNRSTNYSQAEEEIKHKIDRRNTIRNQIEKKKINKKNKRESLPKIRKILKRKNIELIVKFFIEKIYIDIFLCIINMRRIVLQLFMESTKIIDKYIQKNETNQEGINKIKQNKIDLISPMTIKSFDNLRNSKRKSHIFFDLSYLYIKNMYFKNYHKPKLLTSISLDLFFNIMDHIFLLRMKSRIFLEDKEYLIPKLDIRNFKIMESIHGKIGLEVIINTIYLRLHGLDLFHKNGEMLLINAIRLKIKILGTGISMKRTNYLITKKNKIRKYIYYQIKRIIFKKTIDMIFYPINIFILKLRRSPIFIDHHLKQIRSKKIPADLTYSIIFLSRIIKEKVILYIWKKIQIENISVSNLIQIFKLNLIKTKLRIKFIFFIFQFIQIPKSITKGSFLIGWECLLIGWESMKNSLSLIASYRIRKIFSFQSLLYFIINIQEKPWFIPSNLLLFNLNINPNFSENQNIKRKQEENEDFLNFSPSNSKQYFELKNQNNIEEYFLESIEKLKIFLKRDFPLQLRWTGRLNQLNQKMMNNIQIYGLLVSLINVRKITISYIQRKEMNLDIMRRRLNLTQLMKKGILIMEPARLSVKNDGQFLMYQIIGISLVHKSKHQSNQRYRNPQNVTKNNFAESISRHKIKTLNRNKNNSDLLVPEKILSSRRRRELRILISFNLNLKNQNAVHKNPLFCKENKIKKWSQFFDESKKIDRKKNELIQLKFFFWPNYRLEDLACMNRYWFDTNNGSRLSMLRIYMYP
uniref:Protein TIC 214 n=1 Tax=Pericallis hybrida TaxID=652132 RepID=A0A1D6XPJ1_9ASTR|nr:hypothetical chloroplast RF19 [Pericallis hybrida]ALE65976.1 hypothetical chloroplast RF19 [Pericallis hybrida]